MNKHRTAKLLAAVALNGAPLTLLANGLALVSQDGFASSRGEAFVATADNPSAIYYNPAGITQLEGNNSRGSIYGIYYNPTFSPPNSGSTYHVQQQLAAAPDFFYTYTPNDFPLSFGLGIYAPFGGNVSWPQDTGFRAVALQSSLQYVTINPVVALKVSPNVSIAAGLMVNYANIELEQGLRPFPQPPNFFRFKGDGWSVGYNLGLLWQPHEKVSLGASFRSSATVTFDGRTEFEQDSAGIPFTRLPAHADFEFPLTAVLGISCRPTPKWNLEFDAAYTDWSSFGTITIYQQGNPPLGGAQNPPVTLNWQPSWMYEFGVTRYLDNGWHVSAGYLFNENSVPDAYYTPLAADLDRHFFSVGVGRKGKRFDFDVTYQFGYGPAHTVTGSSASSTPTSFSGQNADGTYDFISHAIMLTVGVHF
jgi:long-chain fatty acid transport protein